MLLEIVRQTVLQGLVVRVGDVIEASPADAKLLIGIGKAVESLTPLVPLPPKRKPAKG